MLLVIKTMAHIYGTSLFCLTLFWLANSNPAFAQVPVLGGSCNVTENCASIAYATCQDNSCVCVSDYVADSSNKTCLPVAKELGSACEENVQCSGLNASVDCVENKCTSKGTGEKEGESQEESGTKDKCTDHSCSTEDEKKSLCPNGTCTTPATPNAKRSENIENLIATEKKGSGGSSVVQTSFLGVIWVVHLVM